MDDHITMKHRMLRGMMKSCMHFLDPCNIYAVDPTCNSNPYALNGRNGKLAFLVVFLNSDGGLLLLSWKRASLLAFLESKAELI